jgi:hypothetical protein
MALPDKFPDAPLVAFHVPVIVSLKFITLEPNVPLLFTVATIVTPLEVSVNGVGVEVKLFPFTVYVFPSIIKALLPDFETEIVLVSFKGTVPILCPF